MAKKSEIINFSKQNIMYRENDIEYKVLHLKKPQMTVELEFTQNNQKEKKTIPFAHLPKKIKQKVKSN